MQFHAQARFTSVSGLPRDDVVNTFNFVGAGLATPTLAATAAGWISNFYQELVGPQDQSLSSFMAGDMLEDDSLTVTVYDITDPQPRAPIHSETFDITFSTALPYPEEVAACLSYQAEPLSGVPQARRRGRVYIGPLIAGTGSQSGSEGTIRLAPTFQQTLAGAGSYLAAQGSAEMAWAVWSRTNSALYPIVGGWVDNAFDTQRRRGPDPSSRLLWS